MTVASSGLGTYRLPDTKGIGFAYFHFDALAARCRAF